MEITITTPHKTVTTTTADLTPNERNALAGLIGLKELKSAVFEVLRDTPTFKKIHPPEVWDQCPHKPKRPGEMTVSVTPFELSTEQKERLEAMLAELPAGAVYVAKRHKASVWCKKCEAAHTVTRDSVLINAPVEGDLTFSKRYTL